MRPVRRGGIFAAIVLLLAVVALPSVRANVVDGIGRLGERFGAWGTTYRDLVDEVPERQLEEQRRLAGSESLLIVDTDADGRTVGVALLSRADDAPATLSLIPPGLFGILPGYGEFAVSEATVFEGTALTALAVSNALGVRIDGVLELGPGRLADALREPLEVDLPSPLIITQGDGTSREISPPGPGLRPPEIAELVLTARGESGELEWLERQAALWQALIDRIRVEPSLNERLTSGSADAPLATGILARASEGEVQVTLVPVTRVAVAGAGDGFKLDASAAQEFVERRMSHLLLAEGPRPRVEILNGNGRVLTTRSVAEVLIRRGFQVVKTDNADNFEFPETLVIAQGREHRADAERAVKALGLGSLLLELRAPSGVVDVSIIVGQDIPAGEG